MKVPNASRVVIELARVEGVSRLGDEFEYRTGTRLRLDVLENGENKGGERQAESDPEDE